VIDVKVNDLLIGVPCALPELPESENPFLNAEALIGAQITRIVVDVLGGTVGALLELRQSTRLRGNTALLRVAGIVQQNWISTRTANEFTAWSITGASLRQLGSEFQLIADCLPVGTLRLIGTSADFTLLEAGALDTTPPESSADPRTLIRFGIADESTDVEPIGTARSIDTAA